MEHERCPPDAALPGLAPSSEIRTSTELRSGFPSQSAAFFGGETDATIHDGQYTNQQGASNLQTVINLQGAHITNNFTNCNIRDTNNQPLTSGHVPATEIEPSGPGRLASLLHRLSNKLKSSTSSKTSINIPPMSTPSPSHGIDGAVSLPDSDQPTPTTRTTGHNLSSSNASSNVGHSPHEICSPRSLASYYAQGSPKAVTTLEATVFHNDSGTVLGGTLEGLVDRLISRYDVEYRDALFTASADLTTPGHFFDILSRQFYDAQRDAQRHPMATQLSILQIMKDWLSAQNLAGQPQLLPQVRSFCESRTHLTASETNRGRINRLVELIDNTPKENTSPQHPGWEKFTSSQMTPHELATALTLLEGDRYRAITPTDYILYLKEYPGECTPHLQALPAANRVEEAYAVHDRIAHWVKDTILSLEDAGDRADILKYFINTAEECHKLHNFSSFIAIASALCSPPVAWLKRTRAKLDLPMQERLESLQDIINSSSNHRRYRELLKQTTDAKKQDLCVPWLSVHLEDLRQPLRENPTLQEMGGRQLINFERYVKFMDRLKEVLHYRAPDLESYRGQGQLKVTYIEDQLSKIEALAQSDDDFMKRAKARELHSGMRLLLCVPFFIFKVKH